MEKIIVSLLAIVFVVMPALIVFGIVFGAIGVSLAAYLGNGGS